MKRSLLALAGLVALGVSSAQAALLKYPECVRKYPTDSTWDPFLVKHWTEWKTRFLGSDGVVKATDPSYHESNVSEAQSYAMLLAVWFNDQAAFDKAYKAAETVFWNSSCGGGTGWYGWQKPISSDCRGSGSFAADADQDIAGALIFASILQDTQDKQGKTYWTGTKGAYKAKALKVMNSVWANMVDTKNNFRINSWNGSDDAIRNPSYHMPAWYQVFKEFGAANGVTGQDWDKVRNAAYDLINAQTGHEKGLARNFSNGSGGAAGDGTSSGPGSSPEETRSHMGFDAIRVPYRMGMDAMWYPSHSKAVAYCNNVWAAGTVEPDFAGMYYVDRAQALWGWGDYAIGFTDAKYEKSLTGAMWGTAAVAVKDSTAKSANAASVLGDFIFRNLSGYDYFSMYASETVANNYYAQTLALMGALAMSGRAWNVWDDVINPWTPPAIVTTKITVPLTATPASISKFVSGQAFSSLNQTKITATLSRSTAWTLHLVGLTSGATYDTAATSSSIVANWSTKPKSGPGVKFTVEKVDAQLTFNDLDRSTTSWKTTIEVTAAAAVIGRTQPATWHAGGLNLGPTSWVAGDRVTVRVRDIAGRTVLPATQASFRAETSGLVLDLDIAPSASVRFLEVTDLSTQVSSQYLISPKL